MTSPKSKQAEGIESGQMSLTLPELPTTLKPRGKFVVGSEEKYYASSPNGRKNPYDMSLKDQIMKQRKQVYNSKRMERTYNTMAAGGANMIHG
jgi:hypothetical protein